MKLNIMDGVTLEASAKTVTRVSEAMKLANYLKNDFNKIEFDDWYDRMSEWEYYEGRIALLLGQIAPTTRNLECYGKI